MKFDTAPGAAAHSFPASAPAQEISCSQEISLHAICRVLARKRRPIFLATVTAGLLSTAVAFLLAPKYTAETVILTPQQNQSSLAAMAQLSGIGTLPGVSAFSLLPFFGLRTATDLYIGILQSRTVADHLIRTYNLRQVYHVKDDYTARKRLANNTAIRAGKDTLIHIRVQDRDPKRASQLANAYVEELSRQNSQVALTEASQRRLFYEDQLDKEKEALADAEIALRDAEKATGLVAPTGQAEALIRSLAQLKAEILTREAELEGMKAYAADGNPHFRVVQRELNALQAELDELERGEHVSGTPEVPAAQLPEAGLLYLRRYRNVKYHEALFEILSKQYEAARLDEAKSASVVQVIDRAIPPERKSWPPRTVIILGSTILTALVASFWVLWKSDLYTI